MYDAFYPGQVWLDTNGNRIQAHGGSLIYLDGVYYWYGENKEKTDKAAGIWHWGVRYYASTDLYNWEDRGLLIPPVTDDPNSSLHPTSMMDRPHILYNARTQKYVCWLKIMEKDQTQTETVLTADSFFGPYTIVREKLRPLGMSAGDFDLAVAPDGKAYYFFERVHSETIIADLTEDYTDVTGYYSTHFPHKGPPHVREATTMVLMEGRMMSLKRCHAPVLLTEHGIYTREREEEIIRAEWVVPSFKSRWIRFFYVLSEEIYRRAFRVSSLFYNARRMQIEMGCNAEKCIVIPNGVQYERFCNIPLKQEDGWVDIGAVVRLAPIKDVKTMIYAFFELASRMPNVRLHIMGGADDEDYAKECYALVEQLQLKNLIFTGRVDVVQYMQKLDFTILTSISEGQPLSVLESMAARRPCVTTEVGCCRELLEGAPGDTFGIAGYCVPPMYRQGLADAMEKMCASRARREEMGRIGQRRVDAYFHHEQMLANYRKMYDETAKEYHLE